MTTQIITMSDKFFKEHFNPAGIMDQSAVAALDKKRTQFNGALGTVLDLLNKDDMVKEAESEIINSIALKHAEGNYTDAIHSNENIMSNYIFKTLEMARLEIRAEVTFSKWLMEIIPDCKDQIKVGLGSKNLDDMFIRMAYEKAVSDAKPYEVRLQPSEVLDARGRLVV